jgi:hypothetical protein
VWLLFHFSKSDPLGGKKKKRESTRCEVLKTHKKAWQRQKGRHYDKEVKQKRRS